MNDDSQHELDDELLSAYLDDELTAEERALVEARLATDPAAQQLLDQLRNVSHSVRDLPPESVGRDFREAILRRVEAVKNAPAPKLSIGRTRRGWVWASLAVAAALLIMIFQSDVSRDDDVPDVAQRKNKEIEELRKSVDAPAQWQERNEPAMTQDSRGLEEQIASESMSRELGAGLAASAPAPSAAPADSSSGADVNSLDSLAQSPRLQSRYSRSESLPAAPAEAADEQPADEDDVVVVHVLAKHAAIKNKSFDQLLASNGVVVDPTENARGSIIASDGEQSELATVSGRLKEQESKQPAAKRASAEVEPAEEVDMVLVEAPSDTIFSCMEDLNHDSDNYLGVVVDTFATADETAKTKTPAATKLATDLGKFNRGAVGLQAKDAFAADKSRFYAYERSGDAAATNLSVRGGAAGFGGVKQEAAQQLFLDSTQDRGRARRLQPQSAQSRHDAAPSGGPKPTGEVAATSEALKRVETLRELKAARKSGDERLQVLFVLRSGDDSPPSATATDQPE